MAVEFGVLRRPLRLSPAWVVLGFAAFGGALAVALASVGGYGWFADDATPGHTSNLAPGVAERIARGFAEQQLRLVQDASRAESGPLGSATAADRNRATPRSEAGELAMTQNRFISPSHGGAATGPAGRATAQGAWLFVFRSSGIAVEEWRTSEAVLEITVVISDVSGRLLQTGTTLMPHADDGAPAVR